MLRPANSSTGSSKPKLAAVTAGIVEYANKMLPDDQYKDVRELLIDSVQTAWHSEKPVAKAVTSKDGKLRIEMRAELIRTPHTTLEDKIKVQLYIIPNHEPIYLP